MKRLRPFCANSKTTLDLTTIADNPLVEVLYGLMPARRGAAALSQAAELAVVAYFLAHLPKGSPRG